MSDICLYCTKRTGTWSGDPTFPFCRCSRCRWIHRCTEGLSLLLKGVFIATFGLVGTWYQELFRNPVSPFTIGLAVLSTAVLRRTIEGPLAAGRVVKGPVQLLDWVNRAVLRRPAPYYSRVWREARLTLRGILDLAGMILLVAAVCRWQSARDALFPVRFSPPAAIASNGIVDEAALFTVLARIDGRSYWAPANDVVYGDGICALLGGIWLTEKVLGLAVPLLFATRARCWPKLD